MTHVRWVVGVLAVVLDAALARIWPHPPAPYTSDAFYADND